MDLIDRPMTSKHYDAASVSGYNDAAFTGSNKVHTGL